MQRAGQPIDFFRLELTVSMQRSPIPRFAPIGYKTATPEEAIQKQISATIGAITEELHTLLICIDTYF